MMAFSFVTSVIRLQVLGYLSLLLRLPGIRSDEVSIVPRSRASQYFLFSFNLPETFTNCLFYYLQFPFSSVLCFMPGVYPVLKLFSHLKKGVGNNFRIIMKIE